MTTTDQLLHTDILKSIYSDIRVEIEYQAENIRKVHLIDNLGISRTYAITHFNERDWTEEIYLLASEIKKGKSIGKTFKSFGFNVNKKPIFIGKINLSKSLATKMNLNNLAGTLNQYELLVSQNNIDYINFATISEVYSMELAEELEKLNLINNFTNLFPNYISDFKNEIRL